MSHDLPPFRHSRLTRFLFALAGGGGFGLASTLTARPLAFVVALAAGTVCTIQAYL